MKKNKKNFSFYKTISYTFIVIILILSIILITAMVKNNSGEDKLEKNQIAVIETSLGTIKVELNQKAAPITVANFISYANNKFYDGLIFHRVIKGFMIQGGGFDENGNKKQTKAPIKIESNNTLKNTIGTIAMARTMDPNSATSQFFINVADNTFLDYTKNNPGYTVFGKVIEGMDIVKKIENVKTTTKNQFKDWPVDNVVIKKIYIKNGK